MKEIQRKPKKLLIPTFGSVGAIGFWLGLVTFFSFYGVVVQLHHIHNFNDVVIIFLDFFIVQLCIVFAIVGYIHFSIDYYHNLPLMKQATRILFATLILTPPATLVGKVIEFFIIYDIRLFNHLYLEVIANTLLALLITSLLLYYFSVQYHKIRQAQQKSHQKLIEQNEQLKARITPHFFFNMLNTLQYLSETEPEKSVALIENISKLYRVSFAEIKEIALTDEIELCKHYLQIEHYRFGSKLAVQWELPDEEILYDMVITSLTLQMVIEKIILTIVEISTHTIYLTINIRWEDNLAQIDILTSLPSQIPDTVDLLTFLSENLNFTIQTDNLQTYFGQSAQIGYALLPDSPPSQLLTQIRYPLTDTSLLANSR